MKLWAGNKIKNCNTKLDKYIMKGISNQFYEDDLSDI